MSFFNYEDVTPELNAVLKQIGDGDINKSVAAQMMFAKAIEVPLRKGIMSGDILSNIFEVVRLEPGASPEYPLDFLAPGTENEHIAYTIPRAGYLPERSVEGDYVMIPTYEIGNAIDWQLRYARDARWDVIGRAMEVFQAGFTKKLNDDGFHTLLAAAYDRNIMVFDSDAFQGQFTKRLVSLLKTVMRRNGGGNSTSLNRHKLTDLYLSPEAIEDMRNWNVDQVDEVTRREIYVASDGGLNRIFGVNLHDLDEMGAGQEYDNYFQNDLAGSIHSGDLELVIGLDLTHRAAVHMIREDIQVFEDPVLHRQRRAGVYGHSERGFAVVDNRFIIAGSL